MGLIVSYDDKFGMPASEIALNSGEHVLLTLHKHGLVIKALARPGENERTLFEAAPDIVAAICASLTGDGPGSKASPLQVLAAVTVQLPDARAVETAFRGAAKTTD